MSQTKQIERVAVVGTGVIGASWAAYFLSRGLYVAATDPTRAGEETLFSYIERVWTELARAGAAPPSFRDRLLFSNDLEHILQGAEWVQENGPERLDQKVTLFADLDRLTPPDVVLATSSSGLSMSDIQVECRHPERCVVGHPFNPPHLVPVVEVVGGKRTSAEAVEAAMQFYKHLGKRPVHLLKEVKGNVSNRLQAALWRECVSLAATGVASVASIDEIVCWGLGPRWAVMGPNLLFHLGGGEGGLEHFMQHLGVPFSTWWNDLGTPELTPQIKDLLVAGVQEEVEGCSIEELANTRDRLLTAILALKKE